MKEFRFTSQFHGDPATFVLHENMECQVELRIGLTNVCFDELRKTDCIRALLASRAAQSECFKEAMGLARNAFEPLDDVHWQTVKNYTQQLDALQARFDAAERGGV